MFFFLFSFFLTKYAIKTSWGRNCHLSRNRNETPVPVCAIDINIKLHNPRLCQQSFFDTSNSRRIVREKNGMKREENRRASSHRAFHENTKRHTRDVSGDRRSDKRDRKGTRIRRRWNAANGRKGGKMRKKKEKKKRSRKANGRKARRTKVGASEANGATKICTEISKLSTRDCTISTSGRMSSSFLLFAGYRLTPLLITLLQPARYNTERERNLRFVMRSDRAAHYAKLRALSRSMRRWRDSSASIGERTRTRERENEGGKSGASGKRRASTTIFFYSAVDTFLRYARVVASRRESSRVVETATRAWTPRARIEREREREREGLISINQSIRRRMCKSLAEFVVRRGRRKAFARCMQEIGKVESREKWRIARIARSLDRSAYFAAASSADAR